MSFASSSNVGPARSRVAAKNAGLSEADWILETSGFYPLRVTDVIGETTDTVSIVLAVPSELTQTFSYKAGQFLTFKIPFEGMVLSRSYSLSSSPGVDEQLKVTVKRVAEGRVSNLLCEALAPGDTLMTAPPGGTFCLTDSQCDLLLFAGGSGITPIISIIKSALQTTSHRLRLIYANRDRNSVVFRNELDALASGSHSRLDIEYRFDDENGLLDLQSVKRYISASPLRDIYTCGPGPMMEVIDEALREIGVPAVRIHAEHFVSPTDPDRRGPARSIAVPADQGLDSITLVMGGETHEVPYIVGENVIQAARRAGLKPPTTCELGYCSTCMAKLVTGRIEMEYNDALIPRLLAEGWILTCQAICLEGPVKIEFP